PSVGSTESGLTEVASLDLSEPAPSPKETAILGRADNVYGNADTMYLAARAWVQPPFMWNDPGLPVEASAGGRGATAAGAAAPPTPAPPPAPSPTPGGAPGGAFKVGLKTQTFTPTEPVIAWSTESTHLHKFEFATQPDFPNYIASGTVAGSIKDQF